MNQPEEARADDLTSRLATFLARYPGLPFCDACLSQELRVGIPQANAAARALVRSGGFRQDDRWCTRCVLWRRVVYAGPSAPPSSAESAPAH